MKDRIDLLRKFFTITVAAFEMQHSIRTTFGYTGHRNYMHHLHLSAKEELEKAQPDLNKIDNLLKIMEALTERHNKNQSDCDKFEKGGICN